jgi:hypothetical protein
LRLKFLDTVAKWTHYRALNSPGDQAFDPKIFKELEDVRRQNKELQEKLDKLGIEDTVFPSHLSHGSDLFKIEYSVQEWSAGQVIRNEEKRFEISWEDLFKEFVDNIYNGGLEGQIQTQFRVLIASKIGEDFNNIQIRNSYFTQARYQYEALRLIDVVDGRWKLTDRGRHYVHQLRALRRPK